MRSILSRLLSGLILRIGRYRLVNEAPDEPVMVLVAAPHTSNWDFPLMLAMAWKAGLSPKWLGKKQMFVGPLAPLYRAIGGIAVDRESPGSLVADIAAQARSTSSLALVVPAEGDPSIGVEGVMDQVREFYADKGGVKPVNKTEPRLREEDTTTD